MRIYRWSAVAAGFGGVLVMLWPYLNVGALVAAGSTASTAGLFVIWRERRLGLKRL